MKRIALLLVLCCTLALVSQEKPYTSLVVDASHLELERSESPKILSERGYEVYGTIFDNLDKALDMGLFFYVTSLDQAKKWDKARVGDNPLVVKAKKVTGVAGTDLVLADLDALKILKENKTARFLENFKVIVILAPSVDE
ncbi:MAG: hypothetical protein PHQ23_06385 [Candidatus Wallbacteria bacterium]|nr:hypothetical protein [Candidatus Wallbacteria bacterium]